MTNTHHIRHPKDWSQLDALHTYLWKVFPMDRFDFIESEGDHAPVYAGTSLPADPAFIVFRGEQPTVAFFDEISEAVRDFQNGIEALPAAHADDLAQLKTA